jgi:hypothetical protein
VVVVVQEQANSVQQDHRGARSARLLITWAPPVFPLRRVCSCRAMAAAGGGRGSAGRASRAAVRAGAAAFAALERLVLPPARGCLSSGRCRACFKTGCGRCLKVGAGRALLSYTLIACQTHQQLAPATPAQLNRLPRRARSRSRPPTAPDARADLRPAIRQRRCRAADQRGPPHAALAKARAHPGARPASARGPRAGPAAVALMLLDA